MNQIAEAKALFAAAAQKNQQEATDTEVKTDDVIDAKELLAASPEPDINTTDAVVESTPDTDNDDDDTSVSAEAVTDEPYTMKSLAEAIELDQQELYEVIIPLRDGNKISISEMKNNYQDLVTEKVKMEATISEQKSLIDKGGSNQVNELSQAEFQAQIELARVQDEYQNTDWKDSDEYDPGKSALHRQQLQDKYNNAMNVLNQARQIREQEHNTVLQNGYKQLLEIIPEWQDADVQKTEKALINTAMLDVGYSQELINATTDPIAFKLVRELVQLRAEKAGSKKMVERVKKAPKPIRGSAVPKKDTNQLDNLVKRAKQTKNKHDEFAAVKATIANARR